MARTSKRTARNPLQAWRKRHELSTRTAPLAIGCSRQAWINWESGVSETPGYIRLAMLAYDDGHRLDKGK